MEIPKFIELKGNEEALEIVNASLVPRVWKFILLVLWALLPFFFLFPLWREGMIGIIVFVFWLASGLLLLFRAYVCWARTVLVITECRVIDHDQRGFFNRVVTEARFDQMDEVSFQVKGIMPTIFRYGILKIQLRGSSADLRIDDAKRPDRLANLINDLRVSTRPSIDANT